MSWVDAFLDNGGFWFLIALGLLVGGIAQDFEEVNTVIGFWACMILGTIERESSC